MIYAGSSIIFADRYLSEDSLNNIKTMLKNLVNWSAGNVEAPAFSLVWLGRISEKQRVVDP